MIIIISLLPLDASAHRSGCHRWHSCPSDTGSYTCGDTGYCSECPNNQYCSAGLPIPSGSISPTYTPPISNPSSNSASSYTITGSVTVDHNTIELPTYESSFVKISGQIENQPRGNPVSITITSPDGTNQDLQTFTAQSGFFLTSIMITKDSQVGTYQIKITYHDSQIATTSFTITTATDSTTNSLSTQTPKPVQIPSWIKNNAKWWSEGYIDDSEFVKGIQYMLEQGIMKIPPSPGGYLQNSNQIPSWIKNNAKWWSEGQIDDSEFVKGMQYLVQVGIIQLSIVQQQQGVLKLENSALQTDQNSVQSITSTTCKAINDILPDPKCTPGATDPAVTQDNIDSTICISGYTKTVRPPVSVTEPQKLESMKSYGFTDSPSNYEFDHLIPLELGGAPDDMKNLWPEPHSSSYDKDGFENYLHYQVCSGAMDLQTAQNEIATNWVKYWNAVHSATNQVTPGTQTVTNASGQSAPTYQKTNPTQSLGTLHVELQGQDTISRGSIQSMTVTVTDGTNTISDASVSVLVTYASGATTKNFGGMTDPFGQYNFSWRIGGNSTPGTFDVEIDASKDGYSSTHGTFSFEVVPAN